MNKTKTIALAISGGVDSSVAAYLLKKQGYDVFGIFMKNWEEKTDNGLCTSAFDYEDAKSVCDDLDIPIYSVNFVEEYKNKVFMPFIEGYKSGLTPNPDILCNKEIKFKAFLKKALSLGADLIATGHYCQNKVIDGKNYLEKGKDQSKDQSYFLYTMRDEVLKKVIFPIGHLLKSEVKKIAKEQNLITANKKESMGICFIGKRDFKPFLNKYIEYKKGNFISIEGKTLAKHDGLAFYTIGQRKGLKLGGPGDAWYVAKKDVKDNTITLVQGKDHPALFCDDLIANNLSWINNHQEIKYPIKCLAKARYRQINFPCTIEKINDDNIKVIFETPQRAITEMQSIVFYSDDICLGGGIIKSAGISHYHKKKTKL
jgi:tRNA-uridine 2-sulfurtransferase